ncbi:MAG: lycopene cyclase domain-containing protein [Spirochaetales bacterium]
MNFYLWLNLISVALPFIFTFHPKIQFYREWKAVFPAIFITAIVYIFWDVLVTLRGDWSFNPEYAGHGVFWGLPVGEVLFFFCIPYACLFLYHGLKLPFKERMLPIPLILFKGVAIGCFVVAFALYYKDYTLLAFLSCGLFLLITVKVKPDLLLSSSTWWFYLASYIGFVGVNGVLTALPVVLYAPKAIIGIRVFTIPLEDFFYNFSFLGFNLLLYQIFAKRLKYV